MSKLTLMWSRGFAASMFIFAVLFMSILPSVVHAQTSSDPNRPGQGTPCSQELLGFPAWFRGLTVEDCEIMSPSEHPGKLSGFIWTIVLNLVEILLRAAGYAAVGFIIYGGYKYMISAGSPDGMVSARKTIMNAVIGLAISIAAIAIVRTVSIGIGMGS